MQLPQSERKYLTIHVVEDKNITHGIVCLLKSSPKLLILSLKLHFTDQVGSAASYSSDHLDRNLSHLRTVNITVSGNLVAEPMLSLAKLLLERAPVLRKMVIKFKSSSLCFK